MTTEEAARALGTDRFDVLRRIHDGRIPAVRIGNGKGRFVVDWELLRLSLEPKAPDRTV